MTHLLQRAFSEAAKLSQEEQDLLAARMLAELEAEDAFDLAIKDSARKIAGTSRTPLR